MSESTADYFLIASIFLATVGVTVSDVSAQEPTRERPESQYQMAISPRRAVIDQPVQITIRGLEPEEEVTLRAELQNWGGSAWQASATFQADSQGIVDLSQLAPIAGSYDSVDPMGLFWSMTRVERADPDDRQQFVVRGGRPEPMTVTLRAEAEDRPVLADTLERVWVDADVTRRPVREAGLVGTLYIPPGSGPRPAIIHLHGGTCSPGEWTSALLATHGFVTLALQYCGAEGLPEGATSEIPLEYFETAINWLKQQEEVAATRIGVMGPSLGGLLALLVGSRFEDIRAVVSIKGSGVIGRSFNFTFRGEPVPHLIRTHLNETLQAAVWAEQPAECRPGGAEAGWSCGDDTAATLTRLLFEAFVNPGSLGLGVIPVERINGPVLLVSGFGDQAWPSTLYSEVAFRRLESHEFPFPFEHLTYPGAGHRLGAPNLPTTVDRSGFRLLGGNAKDAAAANADYWPRMIEFLREHLGTGARD